MLFRSLSFESPGTADCFEGEVSLPADVSCAAPAGVWHVFAVLMTPAGQFLSAGSGCNQGSLIPVTTGPDVAEVAVPVNLAQSMSEALCGGVLGNQGQPYLEALDWIATPPTKDGGPHLLHGAVWNQRWWVAGVQDGFVSFDFPKQSADPPPKLANWTVHGHASCVRLVRAGNDLVCSGRTHKLQVLHVAADGQSVTGASERFLDSSLRVEGMRTVGNTLYVAVHQKGLRALQVAADLPEQPFAVTGLTDSWDLAPLQESYLAVADGEGGLDRKSTRLNSSHT